ncbi:rhodanese-like domain-containing protein [Massilibacterium senegalense]|uniref:rhodanese-like domain-containing protein n=1 Tax=Massilibacterium senegalense TaxID=1632858 RepID=UPI000785E41B|nr:rhodanese-like domain-containing protein [Massilibacterium senegalense]
MYKNIPVEQFVQEIKDGLLKNEMIVDVREWFEWNECHLSDAVLKPMQTIPHEMNQFSSEQEIYIVCAHGVRSEHVAHFLATNGFTNIINVQDGMAAIVALVGEDSELLKKGE